MPSEKKYRAIEADGNVSAYEELPCWQVRYGAQKKSFEKLGRRAEKVDIEEAEVFISLVVPAYNEEERLGVMLTEAVEYLEREYEYPVCAQAQGNGSLKNRHMTQSQAVNGLVLRDDAGGQGWEILVISDGSTDKTVDTALAVAKSVTTKAASSIRVVELHENRGKGGAVTAGMRHVRGQYAIFADADGASKFEDLGKLVREIRKVEDAKGRAVAVGSRAHLVGSEAVVQVRPSFLL